MPDVGAAYGLAHYLFRLIAYPRRVHGRQHKRSREGDIAAVDRELKGGARRRPARIRQSISSELKRLDRKKLEELGRAGYRRCAVEPGELELRLVPPLKVGR